MLRESSYCEILATREPPVTLEYGIFRETASHHPEPSPYNYTTVFRRRHYISSEGAIGLVGLPTLEENSALLSAVETQIQLDPQIFQVFLSALNEDPSKQLLVESMQSEVSSITTGVHGRGESLESRHSVEEQSTPAVKRTCLLDEDIVSPTLHSEKQSVKRRLSSITTGASTESMHSVEEQSTPPVKRKCIHDEYVTTPTSGGVGEIVDSTEESEDESGSTKERGSSPTEESEEYEALSEKEELLMILQNNIAQNDVDSFHCHLDELVRLHQNDKWLKKLSEKLLCYAAYVGSNPVIETLIQNGVDINAMSRVPEHPAYSHVKMSPLHWAAERGRANTVKCLVEKGANLYSLDNAAYTPLHWAARNGHDDTVQYLVEKGANLHSQDGLGRTPLDWAVIGGYGKVEAYLKRAADPETLWESESAGRQQEQRHSAEEVQSRVGTKKTEDSQSWTKDCDTL